MGEDADFLEGVRARLARLSDAELRRVVTVETSAYRAEALAIAREELGKRGIEVPSAEAAAAAEAEREPERPVRWLRVYRFLVALTFVSTAYAGVSDFQRLQLGSWLFWYGQRLAFIALLLWGLVKMRRWAYYLNWVFLAMPAALMFLRSSVSVGSLISYVVLWAAPNFVYFDKRRQLFGPAVLRSGR